MSQIILEGTPITSATGQYSIQGIGSDQGIQTICLNWTIDVVETAPPIIIAWIEDRSECRTTGVGQVYHCAINGTFANQYQEPMHYTLQTLDETALPIWMQWDSTTMMITGIPTIASTLTLQMKVTNPKSGLFVVQNWTLTIVPTLTLEPFNDQITITDQSTIPYRLGDLIVSTPSPQITVQMTLNPSNLGTLSTGTIGGVSSVYNASLGLWQTGGPIEYVNAILSLVTFQLNSNAVLGNEVVGTIEIHIHIHISDSFDQMISAQMTLSLTGTPRSISESSRNNVPSESPSDSSNLLSKRSWALVVGVVVAGLVTISSSLLVGVMIWWYRRRRRKQKILFEKPGSSKTVMMDTLRIDRSKVRQIKSKDVEIGRILGQGGFGTVYKGIWKSGGTIEVAVKKLNPGCETMSEILQSFEKEIELMSGFRHPNVVQIYGVYSDANESGTQFSTPYSIVMEFMAGGALDKILYDHSHDLSESRRSSIIEDCLSGLIYLHSQGIMHRDIKSANVLLDHNQRAKWTDFGISRIVDEQQKTLTKGQGTISWMAPEIIRGETHYTMKADVYSFGILLWEIVARQQPFKELVNQFQIYEHILSGMRPTLPATTPTLLAEIIQWCWQSEAEARPSMEQIQQRLKGETPEDHV